MRRISSWFVVIFLFGILAPLYSQDLLGELQRLRDLKKNKQISRSQFELLLDNLIEKFSKEKQVGADPTPSSDHHFGGRIVDDGVLDRGHDAEDETVQVTMKLLALTYWRAKNMVDLIPNIELTCDKQPVQGKIYHRADGDMRFLFTFRVSPGVHQFLVTYAARARKRVGREMGPWGPQTFQFSFSADIRNDAQIIKVMDFVARQDLLDSKPDANFMDFTDYNELLATRKKQEKGFPLADRQQGEHED